MVGAGLVGYRDVASAVLHPHDADWSVRSLRGRDWAGAFLENERFASSLLRKEKELGLDHLPVHLFGCAPLTLMLHLASCLPRRPLCVYQQSGEGGWSLGYDRSLAPASEDFLRVEGLPTAKQGGRGYVALIVEVTRSIRDKALAEFQKRHGSELMATVCVTPMRGPSPVSIQHPSEVSRAAEQLRGVLDGLHKHVEGAHSVLLAMDCPGSFAAALGTAVNANTQHPLWLQQYDGDRKQYMPVYELRAQREGPTVAEPTEAQLVEAKAMLVEVRQVHQELVTWLREPARQSLLDSMGGEKFLDSQVEDEPVLTSTPLYRHVGGIWSFEVGLLLGLKALRERVGSFEDWHECVRLFMVHEVFHVHQRGLTSYNFSGSGRMGFVLEAADFDADAEAAEAALAWREAKRPDEVKRDGRMRMMESIIWNALESLRIFEPERPVKTLAERRLRRYLIWLFHACRLYALRNDPSATPVLERVTAEIVGLSTFPDPFETYSQQRVRLLEMDPSESPAMGIYFQRKLVRDEDQGWVARVLAALSRWDSLPRKEAQEEMRRLFEELFNRHRELIQAR
ncbi:SAVED domain-containing protein [Myxococcus sp. CA033]|uniref:SAVED domain-containing protein n=1 Tax=Myxococcus sp. CA033 TaxID=2741516 RepID=UPI0020C69482|nr:SAVED domain-containing protein [Myxococcus sp. CA033]